MRCGADELAALLERAHRTLDHRGYAPAPAEWAPRPEWFDEAACRGVDPGLFHPARGDYAVERNALAICAGCPVRDQCLTHAVTHHELHGIWGGTSARERRDMRRQVRH